MTDWKDELRRITDENSSLQRNDPDPDPDPEPVSAPAPNYDPRPVDPYSLITGALRGYAEGQRACQTETPDAVQKAAEDHFEYAARLRTGETIVFQKAEINGAWVHLEEISNHSAPLVSGRPEFTFDRGMDVRIEDIVWVADAPWGS